MFLRPYHYRHALQALAMTACFVTSMLSPLSAQDTTGVGGATGKIRDQLGSPVQGAKICLIPDGRCAETNAEGTFLISDLRPGTYNIEVTILGQPVLRQSGAEVRAGVDARIEVSVTLLEGQRQEITVTESAFLAPEEIKSSGFLVQRQEIAKSAGALQDVAQIGRAHV